MVLDGDGSHSRFGVDSANGVNCVTTVGSLQKAPHACQPGAILQVGPTTRGRVGACPVLRVITV